MKVTFVFMRQPNKDAVEIETADSYVPAPITLIGGVHYHTGPYHDEIRFKPPGLLLENITRVVQCRPVITITDIEENEDQ